LGQVKSEKEIKQIHKDMIQIIHENHDHFIAKVPPDNHPLLRRYVIRLIHQTNLYYNTSITTVNSEKSSKEINGLHEQESEEK